MNKKKLAVMFCVCVAAGAVFAKPGGHRGGYRTPPVVHHHGGLGHHGGWGRGGRNFWPGFVGGVVGGVIASSFADTVVATPVVTTPAVAVPAVATPVVAAPAVTTPVVVTTQPVVTHPVQVWVEGCYVNQVQANGTVLRVWQPGHYEYR